ncbi:unnamed protein product [Cochlearia groenlandica]
MNRGNLRQAVSGHDFKLRECCNSVPQAVSLTSSEQIKIMDAESDNSLALYKPKRRRSNRASNLLLMGSFLGKLDMSEIPMDVLIEILIRLPLYSLSRFKCVSKQWSSLISCRYFCQRSFKLTSQQPCLYLSFVESGEKGKRGLLPISSDKTGSLVVDRDLSILGIGGKFVNSLHGFICLYVGEKLRIYNPRTKQLLTLPDIKPDIIAKRDQYKQIEYCFGHDPVSDQYKLVCSIGVFSLPMANLKSEHWVFVLKEGGGGGGDSWRKVVVSKDYQPHFPGSLGRSTSGYGSVVRYIGWFDMYKCAVVSFDVRSEEFTINLVPRDAAWYVAVPALEMMANIIEYDGKIAIFDYFHMSEKGEVYLWVFKDGEWFRERMVLQHSQRDLVHGIDYVVKGTTPDGKVILVPCDFSSRLFFLCYDMVSNDLRMFGIKGLGLDPFETYYALDLKFIDESESFIYLET